MQTEQQIRTFKLTYCALNIRIRHKITSRDILIYKYNPI